MRSIWVALAAIGMAVVLVFLLWFLAVQQHRSGRGKPFLWDGADQSQPSDDGHSVRGSIHDF